MIINGEDVINQIVTNRQAWIQGTTGSYKTSLAYRLSYELVKRKEVKYIFTNNASVWGDDMSILDDQINGVMILDEGGLYIDTKQEVKDFTALAMKLNVIYLIPSYQPPPKGMQNLKIEPFGRIIDSGIPLVIYKWTTKTGGTKDHGYFFWINPSEIFGIYSRQDPGGTTIKMLEQVQRVTANLYKKFGHENPTKRVDIGWWEVKDRIEELLEEK